MKYYLVIMIITYLLIGCSNSNLNCSTKKTSAEYGNLSLSEKFEMVDIKQLLSHPNKYQDLNIEVVGIYKNSFEKSALYLNINDASSNNMKRAVWVTYRKAIPLYNKKTGIDLLGSYEEFKKIFSKCVRIRGHFNSNSKGHENNYLGELDNIVSVEIFD